MNATDFEIASSDLTFTGATPSTAATGPGQVAPTDASALPVPTAVGTFVPELLAALGSDRGPGGHQAQDEAARATRAAEYEAIKVPAREAFNRLRAAQRNRDSDPVAFAEAEAASTAATALYEQNFAQLKARWQREGQI